MKLKNARILTIVSDDYDDLELWYPMIRLREEGAKVDVAGEKAKQVYVGKSGLKVESDLSFKDVNIEAYDAMIIPGGWAPDYLRRIDEVLKMVQYMDENNKVIGVICHAPWILSSANLLEGRTLTSTPGIKDDIRHAGGQWVNKPAFVDGNLVSGRRPVDLHIYLPKLIETIANHMQ